MKYALVNGHLLDGSRDMVPRDGLAVIVEDGKFSAIVDGGSSLIKRMKKIDLQGGYLCPGLINAHVHLVIEGKRPKSEKPTDYRKLVQSLRDLPPVKWYFLRSEAANAEKELLSGVTTIRTVGGIYDWDGIVRDRVIAGKVNGPRIISSNMAVSVPGGHFAGSLATEATSPQEAVAHVNQIAQSGADIIKLMITGGVMDATAEGEPGALRMPAGLVRAACVEAHRLGLQVAAHVESSEGVRVALENGVDTIEHGSALDDEMIALFKEHGAAFINTLSPLVPYVYMDMETARCGELGRENGTIVAESILQGVRQALDAGIPMGLGTDTGCPFITHYDMWRELVYFCRLSGVSPAFALHTATLANAQILGIDGETGSIEPGKDADFIVTRKNPLEDLTTLRELAMVARAGKIIRDPKPKKNAETEAALDATMALL